VGIAEHEHRAPEQGEGEDQREVREAEPSPSGGWPGALEAVICSYAARRHGAG
jgi:hypothetical protein